jgi:hypothetical protein
VFGRHPSASSRIQQQDNRAELHLTWRQTGRSLRIDPDARIVTSQLTVIVQACLSAQIAACDRLRTVRHFMSLCESGEQPLELLLQLGYGVVMGGRIRVHDPDVVLVRFEAD